MGSGFSHTMSELRKARGISQRKAAGDLRISQALPVSSFSCLQNIHLDIFAFSKAPCHVLPHCHPFFFRSCSTSRKASRISLFPLLFFAVHGVLKYFSLLHFLQFPSVLHLSSIFFFQLLHCFIPALNSCAPAFQGLHAFDQHFFPVLFAPVMPSKAKALSSDPRLPVADGASFNICHSLPPPQIE